MKVSLLFSIALIVCSTVHTEVPTTYLRNTDPQTNKQFPFVEQSTQQDKQGVLHTTSKLIAALPSEWTTPSCLDYFKTHKKDTVVHTLKIGVGAVPGAAGTLVLFFTSLDILDQKGTPRHIAASGLALSALYSSYYLISDQLEKIKQELQQPVPKNI